MSPWLWPVVLWAVMAVAMAIGWAWQKRTTNIGVVDAIWAAGVGGSALLYAWLGDGAVMPRIVLAALGGVWGARLSLFLFKRVLGGPEDGRYAHMRTHWNSNQFYIFLFFQAQALLVVMFSIPFIPAVRNPVEGITAWTVAAIAMWLISVGGEAIADQQLARFVSDPRNKGRTMRAGLWRYSRHPNYFFEWLHWFAYVFLAIGSSIWWLALAGPVVMYLFLRYISGVPYTEAQSLRSRGDDYREYQRTTPMLFPWVPKPSLQPAPPATPAGIASNPKD